MTIKEGVICCSPTDRCRACAHYYGKAEFCIYKTEATEADVQMTEIESLRGFAKEILECWPFGDVDGFELQDLAIKYGLLRQKDPAPDRPCAEDCMCGESYDLIDFANGDVECYEKTKLLSGL